MRRDQSGSNLDARSVVSYFTAKVKPEKSYTKLFKCAGASRPVETGFASIWRESAPIHSQVMECIMGREVFGNRRDLRHDALTFDHLLRR